MDTFVLDAPIFSKTFEVMQSKKIMEDKYSGHIVIDDLKMIDKINVKKRKFK